MSYLPHQVKASDELVDILTARGVALLFGAMRAGKTATAIRTAELLPCTNVLVLTKKSAIAGWHSELKRTGAQKKFTVTNYEQAGKLPNDFDFAVLDESHNIGRPGRPTKKFQLVRGLLKNIPVLLSTGTPMVESPLSAYYQFAVTNYTPLPYTSFYRFFDAWGVPNKLWANGRHIEQYNKARPELLDHLAPYTVRMSQDDAGIKHQATDQVHKIQINSQLITDILADGVVTIRGKEYAFESDIGARAAVHQIEAGAVKLDGNIIDLPDDTVVDYIRDTFGDHPGIGLMCHYHSTRWKVKTYLPNCQVFSSVSDCEGVDLSHLDHFVIVNSDYSGAKFLQRRERIVNLRRTSEAVVHHIITSQGVSETVYQMVSKKRDFNLQTFRRLRAGIRHSEKNSRLP